MPLWLAAQPPAARSVPCRSAALNAAAVQPQWHGVVASPRSRLREAGASAAPGEPGAEVRCRCRKSGAGQLPALPRQHCTWRWDRRRCGLGPARCGAPGSRVVLRTWRALIVRSTRSPSFAARTLGSCLELLRWRAVRRRRRRHEDVAPARTPHARGVTPCRLHACDRSARRRVAEGARRVQRPQLAELARASQVCQRHVVAPLVPAARAQCVKHHYPPNPWR